MTRHLVFRALAGLIVLCGCARERVETTGIGEVAGQGFVAEWRAELPLPAGQRVKSISERGGKVFVQTTHNLFYTLSAAGGGVEGVSQASGPTDVVGTPVQVKDNVLFPTTTALRMFSRSGQFLREVKLPRATRGGIAVEGDFAYLGLDYPDGARLAAIDLARAFGNVRWELLTGGGIAGRPAVYRNAIFVATTEGRVFAVDDSRSPIWPLAGGFFNARGPVLADLVVDADGLYVAVADSKLYCLDRATGRIKWQYYAGSALRKPPVATDNAVFVHVPGQGVAKIEKSGEPVFRQPAWIVPGTQQFLSHDDRFVYLRTVDNGIVAVDRATGRQQFRARRSDLVAFHSNPAGPMIYAANATGTVLCIRPVTEPGVFGELVLAD
jgi:outer membrane protein assembly factor BamB